MKSSFIIGFTLGTIASVAAYKNNLGARLKKSVKTKMNRV